MAGIARKEIDSMIAAIDDYIARTLAERAGFPILKECCLENGWDCDALQRIARAHAPLACAVRRLNANKEVRLERLAATGVIDKSMATLSLKQLGWRDKADPAADLNMGEVAHELDQHLRQRIASENRGLRA